MGYGLGLTAILVVLWLVLSGSYTLSGEHTVLLVMAVLSIAAAVGLSFRMRILDRETVPLKPFPALFAYWGWLGREIVNANIAVVKMVMRPQIDIQPRLVRVPVNTKVSDLGHTVFANSITLTPGTVTVDIEEDAFLVHAIDQSMTDPAGFAEIGARADLASDGKKGKV